MKEKKNPILLITAIVVLMGVIMVINATGMFGDNKPQSMDAPTGLANADQNAENVDRADAIDTLKRLLEIGDDGPVDAGTGTVAFVPPENPSIEIPRSAGRKQVPTENDTGAQWWTDQSHSKGVADEIERKRGGQ